MPTTTKIASLKNDAEFWRQMFEAAVAVNANENNIEGARNATQNFEAAWEMESIFAEQDRRDREVIAAQDHLEFWGEMERACAEVCASYDDFHAAIIGYSNAQHRLRAAYAALCPKSIRASVLGLDDIPF